MRGIAAHVHRTTVSPLIRATATSLKKRHEDAYDVIEKSLCDSGYPPHNLTFFNTQGALMPLAFVVEIPLDVVVHCRKIA